ncbi:MAG: DHH family phosphoesterase [Verrucomicrobiota bacterium]|nr:DHH family phosphoesterase [Limisphaera sp.]MDW8380726.1 DHH family phosphoesterase [Verrucomicrobiota bacterium]
MVPLSKPDVILTHESDLDGLLAGVLLQRLAEAEFGERVRLEAWSYHGLRQRPLHENVAWVTDLSWESRMDRPRWLIIDHHPYDAPPRHACLIHDPHKSAALLCYELCRKAGLSSSELDRLVHLNNVADLFLEEDPEFELATDYANLVKIYGFWNLLSLVEGQIERLLDHPLLEVMRVKREVENPIGLAWSRERILEITPTAGLVETVVGNPNLIVHRLLEDPKTRYPVLMSVVRRGNGCLAVSVRSRNGEALSLATRLQGGGHPNAAAATLPRSIRTVEDAIQYLRQTLNPVPASQLNLLGDLFR